MSEITLYRATIYGNGVENINATRVTESSYFTLDHRRKERCNAFAGHGFCVFSTEKEAIDWLRQRKENALETAKSTVRYYEKEIKEFNEKYPNP